MVSVQQIFIRLGLSILLAGFIGIERESIRKPAGLRTHILVCTGSTLVMLVGLYIFDDIRLSSNIDPLRLSAQVISGIGFLGAGTIIKEGDSVRGLTTAASLWAVACIGLAIGAGFYMGAVATTFFILITLLAFTKVEDHIKSRRDYVTLIIISIDQPGQLGKIGVATGHLGATIENIDLEKYNSNEVKIKARIRVLKIKDKFELLEKIKKQDGIIKVTSR